MIQKFSFNAYRQGKNIFVLQAAYVFSPELTI